MARHIRIRPFGRLGNRMFQHMFALALQARVPEATISGTSLPEWGISPPLAPPQPSAERLMIRRHDVPFDRLARRLQASPDIDVDVLRLNLRMAYYKGLLDTCRRAFPPGHAHGAGPEEIAINIRGAEILTGLHKNFIPMPVSFYEHIVAETGLQPVFVGQIGDDRYSDALRARFPGARFVSHGFGLEDFHFLRASHNIVVAISSYSWLAAWLSETAERIFMPVAGIYHPAARPDIDLLPRDDKRYTLFQTDLRSWKGKPQELARLIDAPLAAFGIRRNAAPASLLGLQALRANPRRFVRCWVRRRYLVLQGEDSGPSTAGWDAG